ncbi:MAG: DUF928 domain-containing protein [Cyanobacteria bacterium P01_F01_bin.116]
MTKHYQKLLAISFGGLIFLNLGATPNLAEMSTQSNDVPAQGLPGRRLGGGTRNPEGYIEQMPLVALIPENNLSITTAALPKFLFYLPVANEIRDIEFLLYDESDKLIYETIVSVSSTAGMFNVDLAEAEGLDPLQLNQNYHWYFSIMADDRAQDLSVDGWTRRVDLTEWVQGQSSNSNLTLQLESATPLEQARLLYQEAQLWHDAAVILENLQQTEPDNQSAVEEWDNLVQTVNLAELNSVPINRVPIVSVRGNSNNSSLVD